MTLLTFFEKKDAEHEKIGLDSIHYIEVYHRVNLFQLEGETFESLWNKHPEAYHKIGMHGKKVKTPRWQQAVGKSYSYSGSKNDALPLNSIDEKYLHWSQQNIDRRLNGLLINWYDGKRQHYMGKHRDATKGLIKGSPIVTISHGEDRVFRFRPFKGKGYKDFTVRNGDVLIIPWETNKNYTHEVPSFKRYRKRRISVTVRGYM